jgi:hypothetical protein
VPVSAELPNANVPVGVVMEVENVESVVPDGLASVGIGTVAVAINVALVRLTLYWPKFDTIELKLGFVRFTFLRSKVNCAS